MKTPLAVLLLLLIIPATVFAKDSSCEQRMEMAKASKVCRNSPHVNQLQDLALFSAQQKIQQCQESFKANKCEELQKSLPKEDQDKIAKCDAKDLCRNWPGKTLDFQMGCFKGYGNFVIDVVKSLWGVGESVVTNLQEQSACYNDLQQKKLMYALYDSDVPGPMQLKAPPDDALARMKCTDIQEHLFANSREASRRLSDQIDLAKKLKKPLSPDLQEFSAWQDFKKAAQADPSQLLEQKAKEYLKQQGIKLQCFNSDAIGQMACEAELAVVSTFIGGAGLATKGRFLKAVAAVSKDAKLTDATEAAEAVGKSAASTQKVEDFASKVNSAKRRGGGGIGQKLMSQSEKEEILNLSGSMTDEERIAAFEKITDKTMTPRESQQLIKMHNTSVGKSFEELSPQDIEKKVAVANEINPDTGKPYFTKSETDTVIRNGLSGISKQEQEKFYKKYSELAAKQGYAQAHRLHAESAQALGKLDEAAGAYKKAYATYIQEKRIDFSNPTAAKQRLAKMSEHELNQLEDLAANSGNTERLVDIAKAKWQVIENDLRARYNNRPGLFDAKEDEVQNAYRILQDEESRGDALQKKAAAEKIKALKAVFPGLK